VTRRDWLLGAFFAAFTVACVVIWPRDLFGPGTWGAGGNMIAWVICGGLAFANVRARDKAQHAAAAALARLHHQERAEQAEAHHQAAMAQAQDHHAALTRQQAGHHAALIEHVTETAKRPVRRAATAPPTRGRTS
jgi:hypothetical protein